MGGRGWSDSRQVKPTDTTHTLHRAPATTYTHARSPPRPGTQRNDRTAQSADTHFWGSRSWRRGRPPAPPPRSQPHLQAGTSAHTLAHPQCIHCGARVCGCVRVVCVWCGLFQLACERVRACVRVTVGTPTPLPRHTARTWVLAAAVVKLPASSGTPRHMRARAVKTNTRTWLSQGPHRWHQAHPQYAPGPDRPPALRACGSWPGSSGRRPSSACRPFPWHRWRRTLGPDAITRDQAQPGDTKTKHRGPAHGSNS
jgi:hypothetical protein